MRCARAQVSDSDHGPCGRWYTHTRENTAAPNALSLSVTPSLSLSRFLRLSTGSECRASDSWKRTIHLLRDGDEPCFCLVRILVASPFKKFVSVSVVRRRLALPLCHLSRHGFCFLPGKKNPPTRDRRRRYRRYCVGRTQNRVKRLDLVLLL